MIATDPVLVSVLEPRSGRRMTTITAQGGPVVVRFSDRHLDNGQWVSVSFKGVAIAVKKNGEWTQQLMRCPRRTTPEELLRAVSRQWLRGEIEGAWR